MLEQWNEEESVAKINCYVLTIAPILPPTALLRKRKEKKLD